MARLGSYAAMTASPRCSIPELDDEVAEIESQIEEAERALHMARQALAITGPTQSLQCVRTLMKEAAGWLAEA